MVAVKDHIIRACPPAGSRNTIALLMRSIGAAIANNGGRLMAAEQSMVVFPAVDVRSLSKLYTRFASRPLNNASVPSKFLFAII
jgi:hypothetical protein